MAMSEAGFEVYIRGRNIGVLDTAHNRKHRLKTLGLLDEFNLMSERIKLDEASNEQQRKAETYQQSTETPINNNTKDKTGNTEQPINSKVSPEVEMTKQAEVPQANYDKIDISSQKNHEEESSEKIADTENKENEEYSEFELEQAKRKAEIEKIRQQKSQSNEHQQQGGNKKS